MVQVKHVDVDLLPGVPKPWWFGYDRKLKQQMGGFVDFLFARSLGARISGALRSVGLVRRGNRI
jgi:hypothetical protein